MINCISIVLNGRNHRGTLRGSLRIFPKVVRNADALAGVQF